MRGPGSALTRTEVGRSRDCSPNDGHLTIISEKMFDFLVMVRGLSANRGG